LAHTFRLFAQQGRKVFYEGEIAQAIVKKSKALGGTMTLADLQNYYGQWVTPPTTNYHGYDVYETMAPSQAWNTLELMNILEVCVPQWIPGKTLADLGPTNPQYWHLIVESKKLAYIDLYDYNSDPRTWSSSQWALFQTLISKPYAATLCSKVKPNGPAFTPTPTYNLPSSTAPAPGVNVSFTGAGDTVVFSTADRWGNMVSWVNSNFQNFGSGVTIPGYGFILNDRMAQFTLNPNHPNHIAPGKRPYDTISAAFVMKDGKPLMTLGLMGGDMQVQGHAQMLVNILDLGANMQATSDMARFYHNEVHNSLELETQLYNLVGSTLINTYGHHAISVDGDDVGGYDAIMFTLDPSAPTPDFDDGTHGKGPLVNVPPVNGFYRAGAELREDGEPVGW
jgi:gamma-glutamyltranspeptidase/glutathione hydrolase